MVKLFVYGTMKKDQSRNGILSDATFIENDAVRGTLYNLGEYPSIDLTGGGYVKGEVYEIDTDILNMCDIIEGHPYLFKRKEVKTKKGHNCWVYYINEPSGTIIEDGEWK